MSISLSSFSQTLLHTFSLYIHILSPPHDFWKVQGTIIKMCIASDFDKAGIKYARGKNSHLHSSVRSKAIKMKNNEFKMNLK